MIHLYRGAHMDQYDDDGDHWLDGRALAKAAMDAVNGKTPWPRCSVGSFLNNGEVFKVKVGHEGAQFICELNFGGFYYILDRQNLLTLNDLLESAIEMSKPLGGINDE